MNCRSHNTPPAASRRHQRRGMLTLEWVFLITLLSIGLVSGLSSVRNSLLDKMADLCTCIEELQICDEPEPVNTLN